MHTSALQDGLINYGGSHEITTVRFGGAGERKLFCLKVKN